MLRLNRASGSVPVVSVAASPGVEKACSAYGTAVIAVRGANTAMAETDPEGRAASSIQRSAPVKMPLPKSTETVNRPLVTPTVGRVTSVPTWVPAETASNRRNRSS